MQNRIRNMMKRWRSQLIVSGVVVILAILSFLNESLDLPHLLVGAPSTPVNWAEIALYVIALFLVGFISIFLLSLVESRRKQAEEKVRESERKYRLLVETTQEGIAGTDLDENLIFTNRAFAALLGYKKEELLGLSLSLISDKEGFAKLREETRKRKRGQSSKYEAKLYTKAGEVKYFSVSATPLSDAKGIVTGTLGLLDDITERKRTEEALRESEERYRALFTSAAEGILLADIGTKEFKYANPAICRMLGYTEEELKRMGVVDLHPKDALEHVISEFEAQARGEKTLAPKIPCLRKDGTTIYADINTARVLIDGRECNAGLFTDITERKRAEEALLSEKDRLQALMEGLAQTGIGIDIVGIDYKVKFQNLTLRERFGDLTGKLCYENYMGSKEPYDFCPMLKAIKNNQVESVELKATDGRDYELISAPFPNPDGTVDKVVEVVMDTTDRKRAEELLRESEKLAATGRMAARIAHEINNPLGGIKNSFLLIKDAIPKDYTYYEYVGRIEKEIDRIAHIVHQMFGLYRQEQKPTKRFSVDETIRDVVALLESSCRQHQIKIELDTARVPVIDAMLEGSLRQVLFNIIRNAIEASPPGEKVKVAAGSSKDFLTLTVSDQGKGIPKEIRSRIFEPFFTTKSAEVTGGLGLGLSVSRSLVESIGGSLDFKSKAGEGTKFRIFLPIERLKKEEQNG